MHFIQKKTLECITDAGSNYVMPIKGGRLLGVHAAKKISTTLVPQATHYHEETAHGRTNSWTICQYHITHNQVGFELYKNAKTLYSIHRTDTRYQKETDIFYVSNHQFEKLEDFLQQIRSYWRIENLLHYERDVRFRQDKNRISNMNVAPMFAVFNTMAINLLRSKVCYSITEATDWARSNKIKFADLLRM
jgi:predicted transposase YbfD/YdcC